MTDPWPLRSSLELGALSTAVPCACLHVKHVLWEWGLASLAESAELLVSELVSNAVNATGQPGQTVALSLAGHATRVLIEVRDSHPRPPQTKATNDDGASDPTDGVLLVAALSTRWNWYLTEDPRARSCGASSSSAIQARRPSPTRPTRPSPRRPRSQPCPAGYPRPPEAAGRDRHRP